MDITVGKVWLNKKDTRKPRIESRLVVIHSQSNSCFGEAWTASYFKGNFLEKFSTITSEKLLEGYLETESECIEDYLGDLIKGRKDDGSKPKHSHYHKDVSDYETIDIYAVCKIFDVQDTSGCLQHAIKKLLVTGKRGHKDRQTDIQNAIDTLNRLLELESE